jgi:hypothetical protein
VGAFACFQGSGPEAVIRQFDDVADLLHGCP